MKAPGRVAHWSIAQAVLIAISHTPQRVEPASSFLWRLNPAEYLPRVEIRILGPIEAYADGEALPLGWVARARPVGPICPVARADDQYRSTDQ